MLSLKLFNLVLNLALLGLLIAVLVKKDKKEKFNYDGKEFYYNTAVDLYEHNKTVLILGINSLEESLEKLYGGGGYLYIYDKTDFFHKEGLGNLEVITKDNIKPV